MLTLGRVNTSLVLNHIPGDKVQRKLGDRSICTNFRFHVRIFFNRGNFRRTTKSYLQSKSFGWTFALKTTAA